MAITKRPEQWIDPVTMLQYDKPVPPPSPPPRAVVSDTPIVDLFVADELPSDDVAVMIDHLIDLARTLERGQQLWKSRADTYQGALDKILKGG